MLYHIIRQKANQSLFKDVIQEVIHSGLGDKCYITSGFYSECCNKYCISSDISSNNNSFINPKINNLDFCVRGSFSSKSNVNLNNFVTALQSVQYNVVTIPAATRRHEKVFIYEKNDVPLVEIIGSSNMTSSAYGTQKYFNHEADLIIVADDKLEQLINQTIFGNPKNIVNDNLGIMKLEYGKDNTHDIVEQMKWIRDKLFK